MAAVGQAVGGHVGEQMHDPGRFGPAVRTVFEQTALPDDRFTLGASKRTQVRRSERSLFKEHRADGGEATGRWLE